MTLVTSLGAWITGLAQVLPMTGGQGPLLVTVIGISMAGLSMLIIFFKLRASHKAKKKKQ